MAALAGCLLLGVVAPVCAMDVTLDGAQTGRTFEGIGAVSAGASSRLLIDYPEPQRSQILDFLFKPNYGAALQHLKVEIGGDVNSTDGCEPSHQHSRGETNYNRGYEWWLMKEAKARNPKIILDCLAWGAPGWIGNGNYWSQDMADYVVNFIKGAREVHNLEFAFTGVRNEVINDTNWIVTLRNTLDAAGLANVKVVAGDEWNGTWNIVDQVAANPGLSNAIYAIGAHYPSHHGSTSPPVAKTFSQPLWASEEGIGGNSWAKAQSLASTYNRNYIIGKMTKSEIWSPITSYYDLLAAPGSGLMRANSPWSGAFTVSPAIWATAHTTQFAFPGWKYLEGEGNGLLPGGGSYVTFKSTNNSDYSVVVETRDASGAQSVTFHPTAGLSSGAVHVWRTTAAQFFVELGDIAVSNGAFTISLEPDSIYTLTTISGQSKGGAISPAEKPFPLPYFEDFESYGNGATPRYFSDQSGIFEVTQRADGNGKCLRQVTTQDGIEWTAQISPYTILGDAKWRDYEVSTDVLLETNGSAFLYGRIADIPGFSDPDPRAYSLKASSSGAWELHSYDAILASGDVSFPTNIWHRLKLSFIGNNIKGYIDGALVADVQDTSHTSGLVGIGSGRHSAKFDNLFVAARHRGAMNLSASAIASASSYWQNDPDFAADKAADADETTRWNAAGNDQSGAWLQLDFGVPTIFNHTSFSQFGDRITAFKIQSWSGSSWVDQVVSPDKPGPSRADYFPSVTSSRVRLLITAATNVPSIFEFAVYSDAPPANLASGAIATASSFWNNDPTYAANRANDNDLNTRWNASANNGVDCWLQLDFGTPVTFNKTTLRQFLDRITGYQIQYWNGSSWSAAFTGGKLGSVRTDVFPAVTSDKVRFYVTGATNIPSIYEFQVFKDETIAKSVLINEWVPDNNGVIADAADGDFESWFELFNAGDRSVDLSGWFLSGNRANRFQFQIPAGRTIEPGAYELVWADNEPDQNSLLNGDLHVNFQLANSSVIGLYTPDGEQMDLVELANGIPDASYGARTDGSETIFQTVAPTPRASNNRIEITSLAARASVNPLIIGEGLPDVVHRVWGATDLGASNWNYLGAVTTRVDGAFSFTDPTAADARRFYRVSAP